MDVLHRHDYQLDEALASLVPEGGPVLCRDVLEDWSVHETALFEDAITRHGKMFELVRREYVSTAFWGVKPFRPDGAIAL